MIPKSFNELVSNRFHSLLQDEIKKDFADYIQELKSEDEFSSEIISQEFTEFILNTLASSQVPFGPNSFYWLSLVEQVIIISELHSEDDEESIFDFWSDTEFAEYMQTNLSNGKEIEEISLELISILEKQVISYYYLNVLGQYEDQKELSYFQVPEQGDCANNVNIFSPNYSFTSQNFKFPLLITSINTREKYVELKIDSNSHKLEIKKNIPIQFHDEKKLYLFSVQELTSQEELELQNRIKKALSLIKHYSPEMYQLFFNFTHTVTNNMEEGVVSYSSQFLPGYSTINFKTRKFVDTLDDLLHENGHHFLNSILNATDLINEDDELIFYSPWRKSLRPIRGIYHAYCTFFWAFKLFVDLAKNEQSLENDFDQSEIEYIKLRAIEEYFMLKYTYEDIKKAFKLKKVEKEGLTLAKTLNHIIEKEEEIISSVSNSLTDLSKSKINKLKEVLNKKRNEYKI